MKKILILCVMIVNILLPTGGWSADGNTLSLTTHYLGITTLIIFGLAFLRVITTAMPPFQGKNTEKPHGQRLLVTLTTGIGSNMLFIGSAAAVTLMEQHRSIYIFSSCLRWTPAIALGYAFSILVHLWINKSLF